MAGVLIERAGFLASLEELLGEALDGSGRLVFLGGEAGVGKTTLAAALADAAAVPVRRGSCDNVTTAEALGPILDALPELIAAVDDEAGVSRLRLFRNVRGALSGSPMLLLLEDVHWADEATLDILRYLGRRLAGVRLMILATFRSEEVSRDHPLTVVMGDLAGLSGVVRMQLPPLTATGVRQLLDAAGSALDADAIFQRTGGNPFYLTEVLAAGAEQVPATVRDAVLARVSRLSQAGRETAAAASVLGRRAEAGFLAAVSGQPLTAVDECLERGVLVAHGDAVEFRHDLARLAVERSLSAAQRASVHTRALAHLTARGSHDHRWLAHHAAGCGDRATVMRDAPLAAARAARLGAHREAAEQFQLALRHHLPPDRQRAILLEQLSYECYLTDQLPRARESWLEALVIHERERNALSVGTAQRWLSRLSWVLGQNADSERYAAAAVSTLESLEPGPELAMAYSNMAQLYMLAGDTAPTVRWGTKAIELARELGDRQAEIHSLNNVGTALATGGDVLEGHTRLTQSLDLALAEDAHEHAARAFTNLGSTGVINRSLAEAERHVADVTRHPHIAPITQVSVLPVVGVLAARRGLDGTEALDEALAIAVRTRESLRLVPVAAARAEAAWIAERIQEVAAEIDHAWPATVAHPQPWDLGELSWWLYLAGDHRPVSAPLPRPFALMLAGEHQAAAAAWEALDFPLWSAYALAFSPEIRDAQQCLDILDKLGAPAVRHAVLRDRHARGLAVPRGPRTASRANPAGLTAREAEVLQLLADGLSYAEVAERLVLSEKTVGHHVSAVLRKLGEPTRSRAVAAALRLGVIPPR